MTPGPHVYGDGRIGLWVTPSIDLTNKLKHRLPRVKPYGVTDIFLPREATLADKALVIENGLFTALWEAPPAGKTAAQYATQALADVDRLKVGALELNIEGVTEAVLESFIREVVKRIRAKKPNLRLRINVVPWKGEWLPDDLFTADKQLYVIVQCYLGNMDARVAEDEVVRNLTENGIPPEKVSVMYAAHCSPGNGKPRVPSLPQIRYRGSIYQDDLMADAGYIS